ncbi:MAG: hypothetical protein F7B60_04190 [Desulfurococcales archaeon]|nr:hypothetical protein [Desulfurococcales archaeon]
MSGTYKRTVKLYWVKNKSRGKTYTRPVIKIVLPKNMVKTFGIGENENIIFDLEIKEDGIIILTPLYIEYRK